MSLPNSEILKTTRARCVGWFVGVSGYIRRVLGLAKAPQTPQRSPQGVQPGRPDDETVAVPLGQARTALPESALPDAPWGEIAPQPANEAAFERSQEPAGQPVPQARPKALPEVLAPDLEPVEAALVEAPAAPTTRPGRGAATFTAHTFVFADESYAYRLYVPSPLDSSPAGAAAAALPLLVLLHGCKQDAADFAQGTAMNALAETKQCLVLYPEQLSKANSMRCWNWFDSAHQGRDAGEPGMIAALTREVIETRRADPSRVYIAGLSAGGAMSAVVAGLYPEVFAAVGVHSGLPAGAASNVMSAFSAMRRGARKSDAPGPRRGTDSVMPTIVFHGSADKTVHPDNGDQIMDAALAAFGASGLALEKVAQSESSPGSENGRRSTLRTIYSAADGTTYVEHWGVGSGPHAWSGGDAAGSFTDPHGPSASQAMLAFFLQHRNSRGGFRAAEAGGRSAI